MIRHILRLAVSTMLLGSCAHTGEQLQTPPERLFLQMPSTSAITIKWRGDAKTVCYDRVLPRLKSNSAPCVKGVDSAAGHREARLTGLAADTTYYYSVGGIVSEQQRFHTAPRSGQLPFDGNSHLLILGDTGTQSEGGHDGEAAEVLQGFYAYNKSHGEEPVDLFLNLGDTAYLAGTDAQWQVAFFDVYRELLASTPAVMTIGNHEMGMGMVPLCSVAPNSPPCLVNPGALIPLPGVSVSSDPDSYRSDTKSVQSSRMPYLDIFTLPRAAESGGVPSGTEQYYSLDYGNLHIVSLDSQLSARDEQQREVMKEWLVADLSANQSDWTIVIFHHPPYSKGANHDSDMANSADKVDQPIWIFRNEFTPLFEAYGVDMVFSGHAHSYERSWYLKGHRGTSDTFDPDKHAELDAQGKPALGYDGEEYPQLSKTSGVIDDRVVYTVAGNGGKADADAGYITRPDVWLRHPAHVPQPLDSECDGKSRFSGCKHGLAVRGAVVVDAGRNTMTSKLIDIHGKVLDQFTITRVAD